MSGTNVLEEERSEKNIAKEKLVRTRGKDSCISSIRQGKGDAIGKGNRNDRPWREKKGRGRTSICV